MNSKKIRIIIFSFLAIFILIDLSVIVRLITFETGLPRNWGLFGRLFLPIIFLLVSLRTREKKVKYALYFFAAARFLYYNSIVFHAKIHLAIFVIALCLLLDILSFLQVRNIKIPIIFEKQSLKKNTKIFLIICVLFFASLIATLIYMRIPN
jgi:hypothetical protein